MMMTLSKRLIFFSFFSFFSILFISTTTSLQTPSSSNTYFFASPYFQAINGSLSSTGLNAPSSLYYYLDIPPNAFNLSLTVTLFDGAGGAVNAFLKRGAPLIAGSSPDDLVTCRNSNTLATVLQNYPCSGLSVASLTSDLSVGKLVVTQPRRGRYFLTLEALHGTVQFIASLNYQQCDSTRHQAPDFDGVCQPVTPLLPSRTVGYVDPFNAEYFYILTAQQASGSTANLLAINLNFSSTTCTDGLIFLREGGMPTLQPTSNDIAIPCSSDPYTLLWLYPPSNQIYFLGLGGGNDGIDYDFTITPVFGFSACASYKSTGATCNTDLSQSVLCPSDSISFCQDALVNLPSVPSQTTTVSLGTDGKWDIVAVKIPENLMSLRIRLSTNADQKKNLVKGETWELIAHFDSSPNLLLSPEQRATLYPYRSVRDVSASLDGKNLMISLDVPYPETGTWYLAILRSFADDPFNGGDSQKSSTIVSVAIQQDICPNSCSNHGTCVPSTHSCTCHSGYSEIDCSVVNNTRPLRTGGNGLVVGLGFSMPVLLILTVLAIAYIWWKESMPARQND